jgi:PucR family transcriptional regulator, purine catabolism regulatory protein
MRDLHATMLGAVLGGEGLGGVAELASLETGGPVAIVLPARGLSASSSGTVAEELAGYVVQRLAGAEAGPPAGVEVTVPVKAGEDEIGAVLMMSSNGAAPADSPPIDSEEVARAAAFAAVAELAVTEARDEVEHQVRASLIEDLRSGKVEGAEVERRAARLGCELPRGALVMVAELRSQKPRGAAALVESEWAGALAEPIGGLLFAILPSGGGDEASEQVADRARTLVGRLRSHGPAALSSFYPDPGELHQAMREAELVLEVVRRDGRLAEQIDAGAGDGVYRLLFRALVSDPEEVRSFYEDTVAPVIGYDRQYRSELLPTLEAYLAHDCNMNATARAIFAHRHTVAYRLDRVKELSGLDPGSSADRERLGLGIKAFRILEPTLPK